MPLFSSLNGLSLSLCLLAGFIFSSGDFPFFSSVPSGSSKNTAVPSSSILRPRSLSVFILDMSACTCVTCISRRWTYAFISFIFLSCSSNGICGFRKPCTHRVSSAFVLSLSLVSLSSRTSCTFAPGTPDIMHIYICSSCAKRLNLPNTPPYSSL